MARTNIKICDVRTPESAEACRAFGVDLVGIHCIWEPPSGARLLELQAVVEALQGRCQTVLVTRQTSVESVAAMAKTLPFDYIQCHGVWSAEALGRLRRHLEGRGAAPKLIGVVSTSEWERESIQELELFADLLLIDSSMRGGTGVLSGRERLEQVVSAISSKPFLIAGGLQPENVAGLVQEFRPWGVDVQSGVERPDGSRQKDVDLIAQFVANVRSVEDANSAGPP